MILSSDTKYNQINFSKNHVSGNARKIGVTVIWWFTNELIEEICKSLGKKAHIWRLPKGLMTSVAKLGGMLHLPLNPERLQKLTENYVSSNAKIKKALGVDKMPVDARTGLQRTLESFKE